MQKRNGDCVLDLVGNLVHGVGAQQHQIGAGGFQAARHVGQQFAGLGPPPGHLHLLDLGEIDGSEQASGRVQATQSFADDLVGQSVILRAALPTHPADQSDQALAGHPFTEAGSGEAATGVGGAPLVPRQRCQTSWPAMTMANSKAEARLSNHQWLPVAVTT